MDKREVERRKFSARLYDLHPRGAGQLRCNGVGRDKDHDRALQFYFDRRVTDAEMRFLDECMKRSATLMPRNLKD